MNLAGDPGHGAAFAPKMALTAAEYLALTGAACACDHDGHDQLRRGAARGFGRAQGGAGRRGYPGYGVYRPGALYERAGRIEGKPGSITMILILTMPEDDKTHPIPDLTGYITEGQILLSRALERKHPAAHRRAALAFQAQGQGHWPGQTQEDHAIP